MIFQRNIDVCDECDKSEKGCEVREHVSFGGERLRLIGGYSCVHETCPEGLDLASTAAKKGVQITVKTNNGMVKGVPFGTYHKPTATVDQMRSLAKRGGKEVGRHVSVRLYNRYRRMVVNTSLDKILAYKHRRIVNKNSGTIYSRASDGVFKPTGQGVKVKKRGEK